MTNSKKVLILVILFILCFIINDVGFSQERRNPFQDWFPVIKVEPKVEERPEEKPIIFVEPEKTFDTSIYTVKGLIWGAYNSKAIINDEIYGIGDNLGEAKIAKISREGVTLIFNEKEYVITTKKTITIGVEESKEVKESKREERGVQDVF